MGWSTLSQEHAYELLRLAKEREVRRLFGPLLLGWAGYAAFLRGKVRRCYAGQTQGDWHREIATVVGRTMRWTATHVGNAPSALLTCL